MVFNLWALVVAIPYFLVCAAVRWLFPSALEGPHSVLIIGIIGFVVGGICEYVGVKGRIFFMPIWLVGLALIGYHLGWLGIVGVLCVGGVLLYLTMQQTKKREVVDWQKAQMAITSRDAALANPSLPEFWKWVKESLFLPIMVDYSQDMCRHNLRVLQTIPLRAHGLTSEEATRFAQLTHFFSEQQDLIRHGGIFELRVANVECELFDAQLALLIRVESLKTRVTTADAEQTAVASFRTWRDS